ncbi:MAG: twin-arginine translocation signal domain-containing protein, partial [bacterium]
MSARNTIHRRNFMKQTGIAAGGAVAVSTVSTDNVQATDMIRPFLQEYGFWDYTTPAAGGMEQFSIDDYRLLLDDMEQGGMNSLLICIKWLTTGYRSKLPFQDQLPGNPVIESDNNLLRDVIADAVNRGIKIW